MSAWRLGTSGNLDLSAFPGGVPWHVDVGHAVYTNRFPGVILAGAPAYLLFGSAHEYSPVPAALAAALWSSLAALGMLVVLRRVTRSDIGALAGASVFAFATPTWTVSADTLWTHGPTQAFLILAMAAAAAPQAWLAAIGHGLAVLCRPHTAVASAAMVMVTAARRRSARWLAITGAGIGLGAFCLVLYNHQVFGAWNITGGYDPSQLAGHGVGLRMFAINIVGSLISPQRGVLLLIPFVWLLLPGLPAAWRAAPDWVRAAAVGGMVYALVQLWLLPFMGGQGFFSFRTMLEPMTLMFPLFCMAHGFWVGLSRARIAVFNATVALTGAFYAFGATMDPHETESGDPFRRFSGWHVAQSLPVWVNVAWLLLAAGLGSLVFRISLAAGAEQTGPVVLLEDQPQPV